MGSGPSQGILNAFTRPDGRGPQDGPSAIRPMNIARLLSLCLAIFCASLARADGTETLVAPYDPVQHWEIDYESGLIWRFSGDATPLSYTLEPQILTVKSPLVGTVRPFFGGDLVMRNRFSLLVEPISMGPEHHFIGTSASGDMEWWDRARTLSLIHI